MAKKFFKNILFKGALVLFSILFISLLLEGAVRLSGIANNISSLGTVLTETKGTLNSKGLRDYEHLIEKPEGIFRIIVLGDSFTWGPYLEIEDLYAKKIEKLLNESQLFGAQYEIINLSISGGNTEHELDELNKKGLEYRPDLVMLGFYPNDVEIIGNREGVLADEEKDLMPLPSKIEEPLKKISYLWRFITQCYNSYIRRQAYQEYILAQYTENTENRKLFQNALENMIRVCQENNLKLFVVIWPFLDNLNDKYSFKEAHNFVGNILEDNSVPYIDLLSYFMGKKERTLWVKPTDHHPSKVAYDIAAKAIYDELMNNKFLLQK